MEGSLSDFGSNTHATYYVIALLQSAPPALRGVVRSVIRRGTLETQRSQVMTSASNESAWKEYLGMRDDSLPGVLLLDESGHLRWSFNGVFDPDHYNSLKMVTTEALKNR
jgi:hypothetical protein